MHRRTRQRQIRRRCLQKAVILMSDLTKYHDRIDEAIDTYQADYVFGLFSGGHDSTVATYIACQHPRFTAALHCDTGIGIPQTRQFVIDTCKEWGIELEYWKATESTRADGTPDPQIWEETVKLYGFPGPPQHRAMYIRLKERPLRCTICHLCGRRMFERDAKSD